MDKYLSMLRKSHGPDRIVPVKVVEPVEYPRAVAHGPGERPVPPPVAGDTRPECERRRRPYLKGMRVEANYPDGSLCRGEVSLCNVGTIWIVPDGSWMGVAFPSCIVRPAGDTRPCS